MVIKFFPKKSSIKTISYLTAFALTSCNAGLYFYDRDYYFKKMYSMIMPLSHKMFAPETAHKLAVYFANKQIGTNFKSSEIVYPNLKNTIWDIEFENPIGLAAGFDKDAQCIVGLSHVGFGFVEVGSITPKPQEGNSKPRVFRLKEVLSIINRYGFNSAGHLQVKENLETARNEIPKYVIGVNLGKNKETTDAIKDYKLGLDIFSPYSSYFVINISSPNTPGLRDLQHKDAFDSLLSDLKKYKNENNKITKIPLLVKIAPDLTLEQEKEIAGLLLKYKIDGVIISNTTIRRDILPKCEYSNESGGLSGKALRDISTAQISRMYRLTEGKIPIIGVGGVFNAEDAYEKIKAGASLVQLYTSLTFMGPPIINEIKKNLSKLVEQDGFKNIKEAIGTKNKN